MSRLISRISSQFEPTHLLFAALGGVVLMFIVAPLAGMALSCSGVELARAAADPEVTSSVWLTLWTSMAGTLLCAVAAIPFAHILARKDFPLKRLVAGVIDIPIAIPHSAAGIALFWIISREGLLGRPAEGLGLRFVSHPAGIMVAMAFVSIPFLINAARDAFAAVPERLEKAALNLGAGPGRVFFTISVPLAWRGILSGLILMWARGMSEFGAVVIVAYHPMITPVLIYQRFGEHGLKFAKPVAVLFIAICLAVFILLRLLATQRNHAER